MNLFKCGGQCQGYHNVVQIQNVERLQFSHA